MWVMWLQARSAGALSRWKSIVLLIIKETLVTFFSETWLTHFLWLLRAMIYRQQSCLGQSRPPGLVANCWDFSRRKGPFEHLSQLLSEWYPEETGFKRASIIHIPRKRDKRNQEKILCYEEKKMKCYIYFKYLMFLRVLEQVSLTKTPSEHRSHQPFVPFSLKALTYWVGKNLFKYQLVWIDLFDKRKKIIYVIFKNTLSSIQLCPTGLWLFFSS